MSHVRIFSNGCLLSSARVFVLGLFSFSLLASAQVYSFHSLDSSGGDRAKLETLVVPTSADSQSIAQLELSLSIPHLESSAALDGYMQISVPGLSPLGSAGKPSLYTTGSLIAVPQGYRPVIQILSQEKTILENALVAPYQDRIRCNCPEGTRFDFDSAVYDSSALFPTQLVRLEEVGYLQSLRLMRVAIFPLQQNAKSRSLTVTHALRIRVSFVAENPRLRVQPTSISPALLKLSEGIISNASGLGNAITPRSNSETMLIVIADTLKDTVETFIQWKRAKGIQVELVTYSTAGGTKEALKAYLQKYYDSHEVKPSYLLIVGNKESIPPFIEETTTGGGIQNAASDYPFSLLSGNDPIPDLLYGRLLANDASDVEAQISRWMSYERSPETGNWFTKATMIASNEKGSGPSDKEYVETMAGNLQRYTYKTVDILLEGEKTATPTNIWQSLNEGRSWITYMGHGTGLGWASTNEPFNNTEVERLDSPRLPVLIDVACSNANYIKFDRPFGKAWVTHKSGGRNAGAVGYYGGSVNISWDPPAVMAVGISKYHFEKPTHSLGASVFAGQLYLIEQIGMNQKSQDNLRWYQLFGDPSLMMRTDNPKSLDATYSINHVAANSVLNLKLKDKSGTALAGVLAAVSFPESERFTTVGFTNESGELTLSLGDLRNDNRQKATLTLTGYNTEMLSTALEIQ